MPAARQHTIVAFVSVAVAAALALAGSAGSVALPVEKDREAPTAPANVRVTSASPTSVSLNWNASTDSGGVAFYHVYVDTVRARVTETTYTATNLQCGQSIGVWVVAYDTSLNRSPSAAATVSTAACVDSQPPTPPSGFRQAATTQDAVVLEWDTSSDDVGVVGYGIYRNQLPVQTTPEPTAALTGLHCGSTFEYQVDAVDAAGNRSERRYAWVQTARCADLPKPSPPRPDTTPPSPPASLDATPPSQPASLAVSGVTETSVALTWSPATDDVAVAKYDIYMRGVKMESVTSTSSTRSELACGAQYWFGVEALDASGNRSARVSVRTTTSACKAPPPSSDQTPPTPPASLVVSVSRTTISLTWSASTDDVGVVAYDAYRRGVKVASVTSTTADHSGLACGTQYWVGVEGRDAAGNTSARASVKTKTSACALPPPTPPIAPPSPPPPSADTAPPSQPTNLLVASATRTSVSLTWNASTDNVQVTSYRVYVNGSGVLDPTQPAATVTALACGTAFTFEVDAADAAGNRSGRAGVTASTSACADTQAPTAPANVVASSRTATSIALQWSASSDNVGVTGYGLYRGGSLVDTSQTTTGIFSGLTCNTNYTLAVDAFDAATNRSAKTTVMVATTACPDTSAPSVPTGLAASNVTQSSLRLTWNTSTDAAGVTGYDVFRNGTKMASLTQTSSDQSGLACGTSYWFGVEALDAAGNRSSRAQLNATTAACPPPTPPPPPPSSGPAAPEPPRAPVTDRSNPAGLGYNSYEGSADIHDARIHDVGDSAILLHGNQQNGVVRRIEISRVLQVVAWATHGIYAKSPGNLLEDIRIDNTGGQASSGITLRMRNQTLRRIWIGGGFSHPLTYYEHDGQGGVVLVEDAELHCTNTQTCIWGDDGNAPPTPGLKQQFTFRRVHVFGPAGMKFLNFMNYTGPGIVLESSFINGRPVTAADIGSGIPASKVTIRP